MSDSAPLPQNAQGHNQPELSVGELARAVKGLLEGNFERVRVRGEVIGAKRHSSGHFYFDLKDATGGTAKIAGVCWKAQVPRLSLLPRDGDEVIVSGRVTTYADRSTYQLQAFDIVYAGEGALLARIERLRQALAKEGLFDAARKRALPMLPRVVGVVTSPTGAVFHDIMTTTRRRGPCHIILWPVPVQGPGAAEAIAAAIAGFNAIRPGGALPVPDVLIVGRGGGSLEDLMAFNEEGVVRAAALSCIPLISAVGHETDTTLIDFAADRRAPTPTAAAEMAVPVHDELAERLVRLGLQLTGAQRARLQGLRLRLERAGARLPNLPDLIARRRQQLDDRAERLQLAIMAALRRRHEWLARIGGRLVPPQTRIARSGGAAALLAQRLHAAFARGLERREARLATLAARLEAASYTATLQRGFALVTDAKGLPVTSAAAVKPASRLSLTFADGSVEVAATPPARQGKLL